MEERSIRDLGATLLSVAGRDLEVELPTRTCTRSSMPSSGAPAAGTRFASCSRSRSTTARQVLGLGGDGASQAGNSCPKCCNHHCSTLPQR